MAYIIPTSIKKLKVFNGIRRTTEGMCYLSSINPNVGSELIEVSKYYEDGKSDSVARDEGDYLEERLEMFEVQYFTGDGSTKQFTLTTPVLNETRIAVFSDGVRQDAYSTYTLTGGTSLNFVLIPATGASIVVGQINKRYYNNDSDRYQQIKYSDDTTTTFLINSTSGDLVRRANQIVDRSKLASDDFNTFENLTASVNTTTYQSAV
jgi:hypothetical protein